MRLIKRYLMNGMMPFREHKHFWAFYCQGIKSNLQFSNWNPSPIYSSWLLRCANKGWSRRNVEASSIYTYLRTHTYTYICMYVYGYFFSFCLRFIVKQLSKQWSLRKKKISPDYLPKTRRTTKAISVSCDVITINMVMELRRCFINWGEPHRWRRCLYWLKEPCS